MRLLIGLQEYSPNTLWSKLSMLRSMLHLKEKTNVKLFDEVEVFVENKNKGSVPKKSAVLSREQIKKFLIESPNDFFLMYKEKESISYIDPSEILRPEVTFAKKNLNQFRDFSETENDPIKERIQKTYKLMHTNQTVNFVQEQIEKWCKFDHFKATIKEALLRLNDLIDESDPDVDIPNIVHAFQTAERIRKDFPNEDWFHLTGLIHDVGKVLVFFDEPQWAVVGDTFVVGCDWSKNIVYRDTSFVDNMDGTNEKYNTKYGMYQPHCGLEKLTLSWGHDEYLYRVLVHNNTTLPEQALNIIRYHSFYPWHSSGDYQHLMKEKDEETRKWVLIFNKYDLYTKSEEVPGIKKLWPYYESLIDKYLPGVLEW